MSLNITENRTYFVCIYFLQILSDVINSNLNSLLLSGEFVKIMKKENSKSSPY